MVGVITSNKKLIPGLDVMKFIMSFLIVDIHAKGNLIAPLFIQQYIIHPVERLAVPVFFIISTFLFFSKARKNKNQRQVLSHFLKRLILLYLFWIIIWLPIILEQKQYQEFGLYGILLFIRDFFFGHTFDASWFLGALIVGVPIVYGLSKTLKEWMVAIIPIMTYFYLQFHYHLPYLWQEPYNWYCTFQDPHFAFPEALLWITIGFYLSNYKIKDRIVKINNKELWLAFLICLALNTLSIIGFLSMIFNIICATLLFMCAYTWKLPESTIYKRLRAYSVLFYVIHDSFIKIPKKLFGIEEGPLLYIITILFCFTVSEFILRVKNVKGFHWLKYTY